MTARLAPRLLALAALATCLAVLAAGSPSLPPPPTDPTAVPAWWSSTDPALALGSLLRLLAGVLCSWLLLITTLELAATLTGQVRAARALGRLAPAAWRALVLRPVVAGTLAVPVLVGSLGPAHPAVAAASSTEVVVDDDGSATPVAPAGEPAVLTMTLLSGDLEGPHPEPEPAPAREVDPVVPSSTVPPTSIAPVAHPEDLHDHTEIPPMPMDEESLTDRSDRAPQPPSPTTPPAPAPDPPPASDPVGATWHVVTAGESFWTIAAGRVQSHLGRAPTTQEVARYWVELVAANADRLPVPGNPDLIFPGDGLVLPPL